MNTAKANPVLYIKKLKSQKMAILTRLIERNLL